MKERAPAPVQNTTSAAAPVARAAPALAGRQHVLALQRAAGNAAVAGLLGGTPVVVSREPAKTVFTPEEQARYRIQITTGRTATKNLSTKFTGFMDTSTEFIGAFRNKANWVNGSYGLAYGHHSALIKQLAAADAQRAVIANLIVSLGWNLVTGGLGEILEGAKILSNAAAYWFDQISNTAVGVPGAPEIPIAKVDTAADPAFKELMGLKKLDELNSIILPLASKGSKNLLAVMAEAGDLSDALSASDDDPKKIGRDDFVTRLTALQKSFDLIPQSAPTIDKASGGFIQLWATFHASPWPDAQRAEQDIWISWLAGQGTSTESWSASAFGSTIENSKLTEHLADIGVSGRQKPGGRLGVAATPDWKLKAAAQARLPEIGKYWASVFLQ